MFEFEDDIERKQRCDGCKYARTVHATGGWQFKGCYHRPYTGKWVVEIKECPKREEGAVGRLIDADALLKKFFVNSEGRRIPEVDCDNHEITVSIKDIKRIIREQPTAYDTEKVVAELVNCDPQEMMSEEQKNVLNYAIEIVRNGGAE